MCACTHVSQHEVSNGVDYIVVGFGPPHHEQFTDLISESVQTPKIDELSFCIISSLSIATLSFSC